VDIRKVATDLCWFMATIVAVSSYGLLLAWIDTGTAHEVSPGRIALLVMSGGAIAVMVVLIVAAFGMERGSDAASEGAVSHVDLRQIRQAKKT
jgi:hypothetical protein